MVPLLIGAGVAGMIGGGIAADSERESQIKKLKKLLDGNVALQKQVEEDYGVTMDEIDAAYADVLTGYDAKGYIEGVKDRDYSQFDVTGPGEFDAEGKYDLNTMTQEMMNPELDAIIAREQQALEGSAANAGQLFSGATGKKLVRSSADITAKEWNAASQRAQTERGNKYQEFIDSFNNSLKVTDFNRGNFERTNADQDKVFNIQTGAWEKKRGETTGATTDFNKNNLDLKRENLQIKGEQAATPDFWSNLASGVLSGGTSAVTGVVSAGGLK
jgi:hypothetical protein